MKELLRIEDKGTNLQGSLKTVWDGTLMVLLSLQHIHLRASRIHLLLSCPSCPS